MEEPIEIVSAKVLTKLPSVHKIHMDAAKYRPERYTTTTIDNSKNQTGTSATDGKPIGDVLEKALQDMAMDPLDDPTAVIPPGLGDMTPDAATPKTVGQAAADDAAKDAADAIARMKAAADLENAERQSQRMMNPDSIDQTAATNTEGHQIKNPRRRHPRHFPKIEGQVEA
jgi:hypothetical protein